MKDDDETPLRDRPIMPHVAELAGEHRGERNDLDDKTRQWLADEAAKTQAWLDANQPNTNEQHSASLLYAQEAMRHRPPVGEYEARRDALHAAHTTTGGDDIDRAERAFWDGIDYSKLGEAEAAEDAGGS